MDTVCFQMPFKATRNPTDWTDSTSIELVKQAVEAWALDPQIDAVVNKLSDDFGK
jgi:acyl-CoA synthetase (NDP forming)